MLSRVNNDKPRVYWEFLVPQTLRLVESSAQGLEDDSIGCFYLTVSMGMLDRHYEVLDTKPCQDFFISQSFELSVVVGDNGVKEAIFAYEVFPSEFFHLAS